VADRAFDETDQRIVAALSEDARAPVAELARRAGVSESMARRRLEWLILYVGGMMIVCFLTVEMELTSRSQMHSPEFYRAVSIVVPVVLAGVSKASGRRCAATTVVGVYSIFILLMSWILPLFPATPKLGPVYFPVHQFIPPEFPLLLVVPAAALDLLWSRTRHWNQWLQAVVSGVAFVGVFLAAQWPFADFLMSPPARNWFFSTIYFSYGVPPQSLYARYLFIPPDAAAEFWKGMAIAAAAAILTTRLGLAWGTWMQRIRR